MMLLVHTPASIHWDVTDDGWANALLHRLDPANLGNYPGENHAPKWVAGDVVDWCHFILGAAVDLERLIGLASVQKAISTGTMPAEGVSWTAIATATPTSIGSPESARAAVELGLGKQWGLVYGALARLVRGLQVGQPLPAGMTFSTFVPYEGRLNAEQAFADAWANPQQTTPTIPTGEGLPALPFPGLPQIPGLPNFPTRAIGPLVAVLGVAAIAATAWWAVERGHDWAKVETETAWAAQKAWSEVQVNLAAIAAGQKPVLSDWAGARGALGQTTSAGWFPAVAGLGIVGGIVAAAYMLRDKHAAASTALRQNPSHRRHRSHRRRRNPELARDWLPSQSPARSAAARGHAPRQRMTTAHQHRTLPAPGTTHAEVVSNPGGYRVTHRRTSTGGILTTVHHPKHGHVVFFGRFDKPQAIKRARSLPASAWTRRGPTHRRNASPRPLAARARAASPRAGGQAAFVQAQQRKGRTLGQARAAWKLAHGARRGKARPPR